MSSGLHVDGTSRAAAYASIHSWSLNRRPCRGGCAIERKYCTPVVVLVVAIVVASLLHVPVAVIAIMLLVGVTLVTVPAWRSRRPRQPTDVP